MPRDSSHLPSAAGLRRGASSPVTALTAFSALVAVSVAVSSGIAPGADGGQGSAFGAPPAAAEQASSDRADSRWTLLASGQEQPRPAAPLRKARAVSPVRDGGPGDGSWREGAGRGEGGRSGVSTVRPGKQAPKLYQGELPVNTLIAPARPGAVLPGGQFGWRIAPDRGGREFHNGTDVSAAAGLPVVAALDGEVTAVFWDVWGGNRVEVTHADGVRTTYNHLEDVRVRTGDRLAASEQLGTVGATGTRVTGPHLHFETWVDGQAVDPQSFDWVDGMRVIPASRSKYSLEVPAPGTGGDERAAEQTPADRAAADRAAAERKTAELKAAADRAAAERKTAEQQAADRAAGQDTAAQKAAAERAAAEKAAAERAVAEKAAAERAAAERAAAEKAAAEKAAAEKAAAEKAAAEKAAAEKAAAEDDASDPVAPGPGAGPVDPGAERVPGVAPLVADAVRDTDGDGDLDVVDGDLDEDGTPNELDDDLDGDEVPNHRDPDLDGDGLRNEADQDRDGDGLPNGADPEPDRPARIAAGAPADDPAGPSGQTGQTGQTGRAGETAPAAGTGPAGQAAASGPARTPVPDTAEAVPSP